MKAVLQAMQTQTPFALATVISRNGSAPRSAGAKMLVRADGSSVGTVGGGALEAQVQQLAREVLAHNGPALVRSFTFSGKDAASMDAICGGRVEVLVERVDPAEAHSAALIQALGRVLAERSRAWLVSGLPPEGGLPSEGGLPPAAGMALVGAEGLLAGELPPGLTLAEVQAVRLAEVRGGALVEPLDTGGKAYIFGAGHVSQALAQFTHAVGFYTVVLDDRAEYANRERFPEAEEIIVLPSYENLLEQVPLDGDSYVVIVTRGHLHDLTVLAQALKAPSAYLGMIGSRRKCALIFDELRRTGYTEEEIQRVHAPIGLPIGAETPEEIGVSIVAQMIQARAAQARG